MWLWRVRGGSLKAYLAVVEAYLKHHGSGIQGANTGHFTRYVTHALDENVATEGL